MTPENKSTNENDFFEEINWEKRFAEKDKELEQKIEKGEIKVNDKERYICDGCE